MTPATPAVPRLTYLRIKNYRALRDVEFRDLTPLTVLIGPNGSGKSTVLDALDFLAEAVRGNLVAAWEKRDRFEGMRTRGSEGNIEFELEVSTVNVSIRYKLEITEAWENGLVRVFNEALIDNSTKKQLFYQVGGARSESQPFTQYLTDLNELEKNTFFPNQPYLSFAIQSVSEAATDGMMVGKMVEDVLNSYRRIHLTDDHLAGFSTKGPREKLSPNGDNLPNVLYYLHTKHPEVLARITALLRRWVPNLAEIQPEITSDKRLLLRFKDAPFDEALPAEYMSGGTMRLAALLTLLYEPNATGLLGIEEPENELHPRLLGRLAEELMAASETRQLLIAKHSPFLLDAMEPAQVWILHRGADGYTQATRAADIPNVPELVEDGSPLGYLWSSNSLPVGDPLTLPHHAR